ncbi:MAG: NAD(P)/FAD-dependent oxidoreductase [Planctomycetota bacterium]|nr:NAD(P)/FAD-dependent oxidoreductase [Planctomycetota bacterium]
MHQPQPLRWAVVGGGMLGMTIAHRLSQAQHDVTLIEGSDRLGGLADAWSLDDHTTWDRHYHVTLLSDMHLRGLLDELGLEREMQWVETKTGFFTDGQLYSMSNTLEFLRFPPLGLLSKLRLGATIFLGSKLKNWRRLERIPVEKWLRRWSGARAFHKIWLPLLRAKLGEHYHKTSAAFIWATIARMYAARRTGLKKEMFGYVPGGYATINERLRELLLRNGVQIRTSCKVDGVHAFEDGQVELDLRDDPCERFDRVVLTTPAPIVSRICPQLTQDEHRRLNGIQYQGIVCASLLVRQPLSPYYVTNITDEWVPFTAVIEMSALVDRSHFSGRSLVYLPKYVAPNDRLFEQSDEAIEASFIAALERMYPHFSRDDVEAFRVSRVRHVVGLSTINYSQSLPPMQTSLPGVYAVNSAHIVNGTLNVNETVKLAHDTVDDVLLPAVLPRLSVKPTGDHNVQTSGQLVAGSRQ